MLEFSHEANSAFQVITECLGNLKNMTLKPQTVAQDPMHFCALVRRYTAEITNAFDIFVTHAAADARKKGLFPSVIPSQRLEGGGTNDAKANPQPPAPGANGGGGAKTARTTRLSSKETTENAGPDSARTPLPAPLSPGPGLGTSAAVPRDDVLWGTALGGSLCNDTALSPSPAAAAASPESGTLPSSVAQTGIPTRAPARGGGAPIVSSTCVNATSETIPGDLATACYIMFDVAMRSIQAREGMFVVQVPGTDEAQAICLFGGKPRPPSNVRLSLKVGVVGTVMRTGIAVNVAPENPSETNPMAVCMPVFPAMIRGPPIGAVFAQRKVANLAFTKSDEELLLMWAKLAAQMLATFPVDLLQYYFDPYRVLLKKGSAVIQHLRHIQETDPLRLLRGAFTEKGIAQTIEQCGPNYSAQLAAMIASRPTQQLLFRCVHHNHFSSIRGAHLGGAGVTLQTQNLLDVSEYVQSVEECWKRTAEDLQDIEEERVASIDDFKERKKRLKASQKRIAQLESAMQMYKSKYEGLKRELSVLCGAPIDVDDEQQLEDANALGFNVARRKTSQAISTASDEVPMQQGSSAVAPPIRGSRAPPAGDSWALPAIYQSPRKQ